MIRYTYFPLISAMLYPSIASHRDHGMMQLDVQTTFLHGEVIEELYVNQPEGFIASGNESLVLCRLPKGF